MRIVWKDMPLSFHPNAMPAAIAARAAHEQGKFWEFHDKVFQNQQKMTHDDFVGYARQLGLDVSRFEKSFTQGAGKPQIDADAAEAKSLGATGTPAFFINGKFLSGAKPFNEFADAINAELTRLKIPVPPAAAAPQAPAAGTGGR